MLEFKIIRGSEDFIKSPAALRKLKKLNDASSLPDIHSEDVLNDIIPCLAKHDKILIFRSLMNSQETKASAIHQASWLLSSELISRGAKIVFSELKMHPNGRTLIGENEFIALLKQNKDISFAALPLLEFYFYGAREIVRIIKKYIPDCIIAAGGIMPTRHPYCVLAHIPEISLLVRGDGEKVFADLVDLLSQKKFMKQKKSSFLFDRLAAMKGIVCRLGRFLISSSIECINKEKDLDSVKLDFSLLDQRDVVSGGYFYFSRGCRNACNFCTSFSRGFPRVVSPERALSLFKEYKNRVYEIFRRKPPASAMNIGFYDDDFFAERNVAIEWLKGLYSLGLKASFVQTAVRSFYKDGKLYEKFIDCLKPYYFSESCVTRTMHPNLFIGTENFSDEELATLGKGYSHYEVCQLVESLSKHKITQRHHLILSNVFTKPINLKENLYEVMNLRKAFPKHFFLLQNITPALYSFYGTASRERAKKAGMLDNTNPISILHLPGYPEFDYPFAGGDIPADKETIRLLPVFLGALERL